jgi:hypothetical protein
MILRRQGDQMNKLSAFIVFLVGFGLVVLMLTGGCAPVQVATSQSPDNPLVYADRSGNQVNRFVDKEAGVVCYLAQGNTTIIGMSMQCLPIKETRLVGGN